MSKDSRGCSLSDLLEFCGSLGTTHSVSNDQARLFRTACNKVLGHLSPVEKRDVSTVDIEAVLEKYRAERSPSPSTFQSYGSRARSALRLFLESKKASLKEVSPESHPVEEKQEEVCRGRKIARSRAALSSTPQSATTASSMILRIPVRSDFVAQLVLPYDLSPVEAARLAKLIEALPMGVQQADK